MEAGRSTISRARSDAKSRWLALWLILLLGGGASMGAEPASSTAERRRSFVPTGWEIGDCPASYGKDAVLCAGTDTGKWKADRHVPTLSIRAPSASCGQARKDFVESWAGRGVTVSRSTAGRCGPAAAPCTELRLKDSKPTDPVAVLVYLSCPAGGPVELVLYAVSARVIDAFESAAREQARWKPGG